MSPQHNDIQQQQSSLCSFGQCLLKVMFSFLFFSLLISLIPLSHFCFVLWLLICLLFTSSYRLRVKQRSIKHKLTVCCLLYYTGRWKCCCYRLINQVHYIPSLHSHSFVTFAQMGNDKLFMPPRNVINLRWWPGVLCYRWRWRWSWSCWQWNSWRRCRSWEWVN